MAIQNSAEFQVVLGDVLLLLERVQLEQPHNSALITARREMRAVADAIKTGKPTKLQVERFTKASEVARSAANVDDLDDRVFDMTDFLATLV